MSLELVNTTIVAQRKSLERAMMSNNITEMEVRKIIANELRQARSAVSKDAKSVMRTDPRDAYKAVRSSVYKKILGGNINILQPKRAGNRSSYRKERKLDRNPHQRGGNRTPVSQRTLDMESYYGKDRGFVLRFLNQGTPPRRSRYGNRGQIRGRHWFQGSGKEEMEKAARTIAEMIEKNLKELLQ